MAFINGRTVFARVFAWLVSVMAFERRLLQTTGICKAPAFTRVNPNDFFNFLVNTFFFDIPFPNLFKEPLQQDIKRAH
jgi:hypothetical protein